MRRHVVLIGALAAVAAVPVIAQSAPARSGVVVDYRAHSTTATVALAGGKIVAVHTARAPRVGARVHVNGLRRLANGTFAARLVRFGRAKHTKIRAMVVGRMGTRAIALGARGTTFLVRLPSGTLAPGVHASKSDEAPPVGATVVAQVDIQPNGALEAEDIQVVQQAQAGQALELEGNIKAVDTVARKLTVTVSDDGMSADFTVLVPDTTVDLTKFAVGDEVELKVTKNPDGTFTLQKADDNGDEQEANNPGMDDDGPGHNGGGNGGDSGGSSND
jgi:hypothetical protein